MNNFDKLEGVVNNYRVLETQVILFAGTLSINAALDTNLDDYIRKQGATMPKELFVKALHESFNEYPDFLMLFSHRLTTSWTAPYTMGAYIAAMDHDPEVEENDELGKQVKVEYKALLHYIIEKGKALSKDFAEGYEDYVSSVEGQGWVDYLENVLHELHMKN